MSSQSFNRKSLLLSGPACSGKSTKINAAVALAKEAGLTIEYLPNMEHNVKPLEADVVVFDNVRNLQVLQRFLQEHGSLTKQFLIATYVEADELSLLRELKTYNFDIVFTSQVDRGNKTTLSLTSEWARQHFLGGDSPTSSSTSTSASAISATTAVTDSEEKSQV